MVSTLRYSRSNNVFGDSCNSYPSTPCLRVSCKPEVAVGRVNPNVVLINIDLMSCSPIIISGGVG